MSLKVARWVDLPWHAPRPGLVYGLYPERLDDQPVGGLGSWLSDSMKRVGLAVESGVGRFTDAWGIHQSGPKAVARQAGELMIKFQSLPDAELQILRLRLLQAAVAKGYRRRFQGFRGEAVKLGHALALVAEVARRVLGLTATSRQIEAAAVLLRGELAEMATGEGKTLAAAMAATLAAAVGVPVHVLTANDYLVERDAHDFGPLYRWFGLRVAAISAAQDSDQRREAYRADVVYATAKEVAFDYLRDRLLQPQRLGRLRAFARASFTQSSTGDDAVAEATPKAASAKPMLRGLCFAIIDEADAILLDEATTPLILARQSEGAESWIAETAWKWAPKLWRNRDFQVDPVLRRCELLEQGRLRLRKMALASGDALLMRHPMRIEAQVVHALTALQILLADRDYAVVEGKILIIDDVTGRISEGRSWSGGLQQMLERKEGLPLTPEHESSASITFQRFFSRYLRLAGLSGTLVEAKGELARLYGLKVRRIALSRPSRMRCEAKVCFTTEQQRMDQLIADVQAAQTAGRPVLIATSSVEASQKLAARLESLWISHRLLNAVQSADEAKVIALAGRSHAVTVSTNLAGRGCDIRLDSKAIACGGLLVFVCSTSRARRVDRQLAGRAARRGEPGGWRQYRCLDDPLVAARLPVALRHRLSADSLVARTMRSWVVDLIQRLTEWQDRTLRERLAHQDRETGRRLAFAGGVE